MTNTIVIDPYATEQFDKFSERYQTRYAANDETGEISSDYFNTKLPQTVTLSQCEEAALYPDPNPVYVNFLEFIRANPRPAPTVEWVHPFAVAVKSKDENGGTEWWLIDFFYVPGFARGIFQTVADAQNWYTEFMKGLECS
jgi:hypothetical protein